MARSIHNSKTCGCCGRLIPIATRAKRDSCSPRCHVALLYAVRKSRSATKSA